MHDLQHELEFERKYLVKEPIGFDLTQFPSTSIVQRYIDYGWVTQRLRCINNSDYILTYKQKQKGVLGKVETEKRLSESEFKELLNYAIPNANWPIEKTRYYIQYGNYKIELDCYNEKLKFLMIAEVEFHSLADISTFKKPSRFGKEISEKFSNKKLYILWYDAIRLAINQHKVSRWHHQHEDVIETKKHIKKIKSHLSALKKTSQL